MRSRATLAKVRFALATMVAGAALYAGAVAFVATEAPAAATGFKPTAVFGADNRRDLSDEHSGLKGKIGTLSLAGSGVCSAFCLAPDVIATASHCFFATAGEPKPDLTKFAFKTPSGTRARILPQSIIAGTRNLNVTPPIDAGNDWALARLAKPVCRAGGLPLSAMAREDIEAAAGAGELFEIAVHQDRSMSQLAFGGPCETPAELPDLDRDAVRRDFAKPGDVFLHTCDTGAGSSGSPMLVEGTDGPEVVGINVGTYVLSRSQKTSGAQDMAQKSEPLANTAVVASHFRDAAEQMIGVRPVTTGRAAP